jgi:hypothetical protein
MSRIDATTKDNTLLYFRATVKDPLKTTMNVLNTILDPLIAGEQRTPSFLHLDLAFIIIHRRRQMDPALCSCFNKKSFHVAKQQFQTYFHLI